MRGKSHSLRRSRKEKGRQFGGLKVRSGEDPSPEYDLGEHDHIQKLSQARDFQDFIKIQTEYMQTQLRLVRRTYWLDMNDRTLVMVMVNGIGAQLSNDQKRAHLSDLRREHLIDQVCVQEILPPEK